MYFFATISLRNELDDDDYHCFFALLPLKQIMIYKILEIKLCGLSSRIPDTEAEWRLKVITDLIS